MIDFAYATVVSIAPIKSGDTYTRDNIWVKRPGTGPIRADRFEDIIGKVATRDIPAEVHIQFRDIQGFGA